MKFFEKLMIEEYLEEMGYKKPRRGGGDAGPSDEEFAARIILPRIKKAKSKADLDKIFKDMEKHAKRWAPHPDSTVDLIKSWFEERMRELGIKESYSFEEINEAPIKAKGWTQESIKKFAETIGKEPTEHGFFDACVSRMEGKEGFDKEKAQGFCASIKDAAYNSPYWRGKGKSKEEIEKQTKKKKFPKSERMKKK